MLRISVLSVCLLLIFSDATAQAQGLLWNLPEDGTKVQIQGQYRQTVFRPQSNQGNLELDWLRRMTISSVGREEAEYRGTVQPCRWIEIKLQTGGPSQDGIDRGLVGERIYKVLVPESVVRGAISDEEGLPVPYIPIVKGYRSTSTNQPAQPIRSRMLQIYPVISLIRHYNTMEQSDIEQTVQIGQDDVVAKELTGMLVQESRTRRIRHQTRLLRSDQVPFGLAEWEVKVAEERKADVEKREQFQQVSEVTVTMKVQKIETGAQSELTIEQN